MKNILFASVAIAIIVAILGISGALYTIDETQQVVVTQFGRPIGKVLTGSGLHFKLPLIQIANYFEKRILEWDGNPNQIPTKDKKYILVDTTARWKIKDALKFLESVGSEVGAHARLDDIIDSATRNYITSYNLVELVRNSNRLVEEQAAAGEDDDWTIENVETIKIGKEQITRGILEEASKIMPQYGIELIDVRIKRINYVSAVQNKVFERMISERKRAAEQDRSEGQGKKAEIEGQVEKEMFQIRSEAYKIAEEIKGKADAEATRIYADAYNNDPDFYAFTKTLDTYRNTFDKDTMLILTTDSEYYKYTKDIAD